MRLSDHQIHAIFESRAHPTSSDVEILLNEIFELRDRLKERKDFQESLLPPDMRPVAEAIEKLAGTMVTQMGKLVKEVQKSNTEAIDTIGYMIRERLKDPPRRKTAMVYRDNYGRTDKIVVNDDPIT